MRRLVLLLAVLGAAGGCGGSGGTDPADTAAGDAPDVLVDGDVDVPLADVTPDAADGAGDADAEGDGPPADGDALADAGPDAPPDGDGDAEADGGPLDAGPDAEDGGGGDAEEEIDVPPPVTPGLVVVTEVMAAPLAGPDPGGQWIEVVATGDAPVDLAGWRLEAGDGAAATLGPAVAAPGEPVLLAAAPDLGLGGALTAAATWSPALALAAGPGPLRLLAGDVVVDEVPLAGGVLLVPGRAAAFDGALTPGAAANDDPAAWCPATAPYGAGDLGTPGAANPPCLLKACGDGQPDPGEACDDGNATPGDGCEPECAPTPVCGNGLLEKGEVCDDGNPVACDGCTLCQVDLDKDGDGVPGCKDNCPATYNPGQTDVDGDGLGDLCDFQDCGNGAVEGSETCDDGNLLSGDGCSAGCLAEAYGPGTLVVTEVMLRPAGLKAPAGVWVELHNPGAAPVDVAGMTLEDDFGQKVKLPPAVEILVPAGGYAVLASHPEPLLNGGLTAVAGSLGGFVPAAGFGQVVLRWKDVQIDRVGWDPGVTFPDAWGASLSLDAGALAGPAPAQANNAGGAWCYGAPAYGPGGKGTPGGPNPPCPAAFCGDGAQGPGEACDDFNNRDGDGCDADCTPSADTDGDGLFDGLDNCPGDFNPGQADQDGDGLGDACDVQDCGNGVEEGDEGCDDGNAASGDGCSSACTPESFAPGAVVVAEVMAAPVGVAPPEAGRWVELYNASTKPVDLGGLRLTDGSGATAVVDPEAGAWVAPGKVGVVGVSDVYADNGGVVVVATVDALPLAGGSLSVWWQGTPLDSVDFDGAWPAAPGRAWSLSGAALNAQVNDAKDVWCEAVTTYGLAANRGTPGVLNPACVAASCGDGTLQPGEGCDDGGKVPGDGCEADCTPSVDSDGDGVFDSVDTCPFVSDPGQVDSDGDGIGDPCDTSVCGNGEVEPGETCDDGGAAPGDGCDPACQVEVFLVGDVLVTEIMAAPAAVPDSTGEWVEVTNQTAAPVDLRGWVLRDDGADQHVIADAAPVLVPPHGRLVLGRSAVGGANGGAPVGYVYEGFSLASGPDAVALVWNGVVIDRVPLAKEGGPIAKKGRSLSLDPAKTFWGAGLSAAAWCDPQSLMPGGDRGTPGEENDPCVPGILCGDGVVSALEACDDGPANSDVAPGACRKDCRPARCGDGVVDPGEVCDDGDLEPGDGCEPSCQPSSLCGNGDLDPGEACDQGAGNSDTAPGACRLDCTEPFCGDGVRDPGEGCDDGNGDDGDACSSACVPPAACGNGLFDPFEQCDGGGLNSDVTPGACRTDCTLPRCGDGVADPGEGCDDGNFDAADGCEPACKPSVDEDGDGVADVVDVCPGVSDPDQVDGDGDGKGDACDPPVCGNGYVEAGELCDDGNPWDGDGCGPACAPATAEAGALVVSEVMQNPRASLDGHGEWIELTNVSETTWNLAGWRVRDDGEDAFVVASSLPLAPGGRLVLGRSSDPALNGGAPVDYAYGVAMLLENGFDEVVVERPPGPGGAWVVVDRVAWDNGATFPDPDGASMALEPNLLDAGLNDTGSLWCPSKTIFGAGDLGTPGAVNDPCVPAVCGNGYVEPGEACDFGKANGNQPGACRPDCTLPYCGDGITDPGEVCDDGNLVTGDGCELTCKPTDPDAVCGDGEATGAEFCDDGNGVDGDGCSADCLVEDFAPGDVVVTELMVLPEGIDPSDGQWIEVHNRTGVPVNINGWRLRDGDLEDALIDAGGPAWLPPGAYALLVRNGNPAANGGLDAVAVLGGVALDLGGDTVELVWNGVVIDRVTWAASWPIEPGRSLSLDPQGYDPVQNDLPGVWCPGDAVYDEEHGNRGTPGAANEACPEVSICGDGVPELEEVCDDGNLAYGDGCDAACQPETVVPGSVVLSEIAALPAAAAGAGQWVEVTATAPARLGGWVLEVDGVALPLPDDEPLPLAPGQALVLAASGDVLTNGGVVPDVVLPGLDLGDGQVLVRLLGGGVEVDAVLPAENWLFAPGRSLSLDPGAASAAANDAPEAWCPGAALYGDGDFGTPGTPNDPCPPPVICGNGALEGDEACDDGNLKAGDGCEKDCTLTPEAACGDGKLDAGEGCDDGNLLSGDGCARTCAVEAFAPGAVVISEIMQNPNAVADGFGEWVEVTNPGPAPVDLSGWVLRDLGSDQHLLDPTQPLVVPPGGRIVLGSQKDPDLNGGVTVAYQYGKFSLSNGADAVILAWNGVVVDQVAYDGGPLFPDPVGASMQLDPDLVGADWNDDPESWCVSTTPFGEGDLGTPGAVNDQCPGAAFCGNGVPEEGEGCDDGNAVVGDGCNPDCTVGPVYACGDGEIQGDELCDDGNALSGDGCSFACQPESYGPGAVVFTELMVNPEAADDFYGEWVEVHNPGSEPVDLAGWVLGDGLAEKQVLPATTSLVVPPGGYAVLARSADPAVNGGVTALAEAPKLALKNVADTVQLTWHGVLVDRVAWDGSAGWTVPSGASLVLAPGGEDPASNDYPFTWCAATAPFGDGDLGSPGAGGDACSLPRPLPGALIVSELRRAGPPSAPDFEYVEVLNLAPWAVTVSGVLVSATGQPTQVLSGPGVVRSGGFGLLAPDLPPALLGGLTPDATWSGFKLPDGLFTLTLTTPGVGVVDELPFTAAFPGVPQQAVSLDPAGWTAADNDLPQLWCVAPPTPRAAGSCGLTDGLPAGGMVISEVKPGAQWAIEVTNLSGAAAGLKGLRVEMGPPELPVEDLPHALFLGGTVVASGGQGVIAFNVGMGLDGAVLDPAGTRVRLVAGGGAVIDELVLDAGFPWPAAGTLSLSPVALSAEANDAPGAWCASLTEAGTLGKPNDACFDLPPPGALVITEVMARPSTSVPANGAWVEILNTTAAPIDLEGLALRDAGVDFWVIPAGVVVAPGDRIVLGATKNKAVNGGVDVDVAWGFFSLDPAKDAIILEGAGITLDAVAYDVAKGWPLLEGHSMSLSADAQTPAGNDAPGAWCLGEAPFGTASLGTPGAPNPVCEQVVGTVIVTEIMPDPVNMADAEGEWLELYNPGAVGVELGGWTLESGPGEVAVLPAGLVVPAGGYAVLARAADPSKVGSFAVDHVYTALVLTNTADTLRLSNPSGLLVDQVTWGSDWPLQPGRSLELVAAAYDHEANDLPSSWCASKAADYGLGNKGTPGGPPACP